MITEVPRDQWGRPLIVPVTGGKPKAYTRASTLAKALDNGNALTKWKQRMTAKGLTIRPDLLALTRTVDLDERTKLDEICEQALVAAGGESRANIGTALHALTEQVDQGLWPTTDPELDADLVAYKQAVERAGLKAWAMEKFVVCDSLEVAGTFDRIWDLPDGRRMIGDLKTGDSAATYGLGAVQIQCAVYANGTPYNPDMGRARPLSEYGVSLTEALLVHLPAGTATCNIYVLNLETGWVDAQLASTVHRRTAALRKIKATPYTQGARNV